jgi:hypothetical protein
MMEVVLLDNSVYVEPRERSKRRNEILLLVGKWKRDCPNVGSRPCYSLSESASLITENEANARADMYSHILVCYQDLCISETP